MNERIFEKVKAYIEKYQMIAPEDTVVVGVSGGADSVCLLLLLHALSMDWKFEVLPVHINHGIRPEGARDAAYVEQLCAELGLPFFLVKEQVKALAKSQGLSEEEAGRMVRYRAFESILLSHGKGEGKIAVAHHAGDRAETMLFHLFRGTGLAGMGGIKPCRGNIIRPLLCLERWEVESYLEKKQIPFCMDATNEEDHYTRNRIRHHILPYAEQEICSGVIRHMCSAADVLLEAEEYLKGQVRGLAEEGMHAEEGRVVFQTEFLRRQQPFMQTQLLLFGLETVCHGRKDIGAVHVNEMRSLLEKEGTKELMLPHGIVVRKQYHKLAILSALRTPYEKTGAADKITLPIDGTVVVPGIGSVESSVFLYKKSQIIPQKACTKWFDYDRITKSPVFRTRQSGDFLTVNAAMSRKKLKDYMIDEKIPRNERDCLFMLADGSHIIWIPGYRMSQYYKVTEDTKYILEVHLQEEISCQKK